MTNNLRTQILLPRELREEIEKARNVYGETLAEYLRKAVQQRIRREQKRKIDYQTLAREVIGVVRESSWKGTDVMKWQKEMRQDR